MQFVELLPWIASYNVNYHLGIDGISLLMILLNCFTTVLVVLAGWQVVESRVAQYMAAFLILSGIMNGVFCAQDAALFYVFFEATLIPMFVVIGVWGGPNRVYAALKFFLYTLVGSLLTLVALIYLYVASEGSFALADYYRLPDPAGHAVPAVHGVLCRIRGQGADVAGAYLAARCARRGANRRLGGAGGRHAEARRLWFHPAVAADRSRTPATCLRRWSSACP